MDRKSQTAIQEDLIRLGEAAFSLEVTDSEGKRDALEEYMTFMDRTFVVALLPALTSLIQPGRVKPWLRKRFLFELSNLATRKHGVRAIIEFVLSVHPSSNVPMLKPEEGAPKGPAITTEALTLASKILGDPPVSPDAPEDTSKHLEWFQKIAFELYKLLDGREGIEFVKVAAYVIGYGILGRRKYGAPGAPGWRAIAEPILSHIDPTLGENEQVTDNFYGPGIIKPADVFVTEFELADALRRLVSLVSSHPNPGLSKRLLRPLLLPLWALASWKAEGNEYEEYRRPAGYLLNVLLRLSSDAEELIVISDNLLFDGSVKPSIGWTYAAENGKVNIYRRTSNNIDFIFNLPSSLDQSKVDAKVNAFMEILKMNEENDDNGISALFITLCKRWLQQDEDEEPQDFLFRPAMNKPLFRTAEEKITDAKVLQAMIDAVPTKLIGESSQVLELANDVLSKISKGDEVDKDDTVSIALSLLNMVFTSASFKANTVAQEMLSSLKASLKQISSTDSEAASTAQNMLMLLEFKLITPDLDGPVPAQVSDKALEDRKTYKLALDYLTSASSPTPVRAQGLDLLTYVIVSASPVMDVASTIILLSSIIQDDEEYIYLRTIKTFVALSNKHPKSVMNSLIERYFDADELLTLDARLRLGEALLQVIEKSGQLFTGDLAQHICEGLLALAGRRGYRPKSEAGKQKRLRKEERERKRAENDRGGLDDISEDEEQNDKEKALLNQIVTGWEGKRGEEDVRIRASALSIFGIAMETNIYGIGAAVIAGGVDLSINILPLEPEPEKAILRRAAVLAMLSVLRAHHKATEEGKRLGFGFEAGVGDVKRVLTYVGETDNDGLVKRHVRDVLEELESWQMGALSGGIGGGGGGGEIMTELSGLRGLSFNPEVETKGRPRIEEIE